MKNKYKLYVFTTMAYGLCMLIGIIFAVFFLVKEMYFLSILVMIFAYVSGDNFFCTSRAKSCNIHATGHYFIPPFLRPN